MNHSRALWKTRARIVLAVQILCSGVALNAVPLSHRTAEGKSDSPAYVPHPFVKGLSGDYRSSQHSEQYQQKLYLQETPAGLLFDLFALEPHPRRVLSAEHEGVAKQVAEGVFVQKWESEDEEGNPTPAWFCIAIDPSGKVDVSIRGIVARHPPFHTARNLEGTYHKVGPEAVTFDDNALKAVALLRHSENPAPDDCVGAARLLGGGRVLAGVLLNRRESAAAFAVDICSAKQGNEYALQTVLMTLGGVRGKTEIDPEFALKVYAEAKENNPDVAIYETSRAEADTLLSREFSLIKLAAECPTLDFEAFLETNGISASSLKESPYAIWELAEHAAFGRRFGGPNAELAFQLVLRGGGAFEERAAAVKLSHSAWKGSGTQKFNLAACLTSERGKEYLRQRGKAKPDALTIDTLKRELRSANLQALMEKAYDAQVRFIAESSRIYCGDEGFSTWEWNTAAYARQATQRYLETVRAVLKGFRPKRPSAPGSAEFELNARYKRAISGLGDSDALPEPDSEGETASQFFYKDAESLRRVQRAWLPMRDRNAALFHALSPSVSEEAWKAWLTEVRTMELPRFKDAIKPR